MGPAGLLSAKTVNVYQSLLKIIRLNDVSFSVVCTMRFFFFLFPSYRSRYISTDVKRIVKRTLPIRRSVRNFLNRRVAFWREKIFKIHSSQRVFAPITRRIYYKYRLVTLLNGYITIYTCRSCITLLPGHCIGFRF